MFIYKCPKEHLYAITGHGEDLTWGIVRPDGRESVCPQCKGEKKMQELEISKLYKGE